MVSITYSKKIHNLEIHINKSKDKQPIDDYGISQNINKYFNYEDNNDINDSEENYEEDTIFSHTFQNLNNIKFNKNQEILSAKEKKQLIDDLKKPSLLSSKKFLKKQLKNKQCIKDQQKIQWFVLIILIIKNLWNIIKSYLQQNKKFQILLIIIIICVIIFIIINFVKKKLIQIKLNTIMINYLNKKKN